MKKCNFEDPVCSEDAKLKKALNTNILQHHVGNNGVTTIAILSISYYKI